jgi:hypothetical protein
MRKLLISLTLVFWVSYSFSTGFTDSLINRVKIELTNRKIYDGQKKERIRRLMKELNDRPVLTAGMRYNIYKELYEEYKVFQFDSAYVYSQKLLNLSRELKDLNKEYDSRIKLGFIMVSSGMFKEAFDCLGKINPMALNDSVRMQFFEIKSRNYSDLADYNNDKYFAPMYNAASVKLLDSAIALSRPNSFERLYFLGTRQLRTGALQHPSEYFIRLLAQFRLSDHQKAMIATALSYFYHSPAETDERIQLLAIGAVNDIKSSTKETLAIFLLGEQLHLRKNNKDAYTFIQEAMDDAQFYGARLRKIKISAVLPIVAAQEIIKTENEKNRFLFYFLSIAAIALLISLISFIVFIQLKRLKAKEVIIEEKNVQLEKINDKLSEDAHIKEEYIGYFFNSISSYILKLEKLKRNIERKISTKKYEDILLSINEINIKKERETLFYTFDHVFLKIFPNFITVFNSLLKDEDQIWPKDHEVLNTDLRIFALMRLGISDNQTIANILEYSVNTIYVYKMRIKAKSLVSSEQFDQKIMAIKAVDLVYK